nr:hypothetical protein Iba_chr06cCG13110 [Ipomoea batatas]
MVFSQVYAFLLHLVAGNGERRRQVIIMNMLFIRNMSRRARSRYNIDFVCRFASRRSMTVTIWIENGVSSISAGSVVHDVARERVNCSAWDRDSRDVVSHDSDLVFDLVPTDVSYMSMNLKSFSAERFVVETTSPNSMR